MGYIMKKSVVSLIMGSVLGLIVCICAQVSHKTFVKEGKRAITATSIAMLAAAVTTAAMLKRFMMGILFPAVIVGPIRYALDFCF